MQRAPFILVSVLLLIPACGTESQPVARTPDDPATSHLEYGCGGPITFTSEDVSKETQPNDEVLVALDRLRKTMDGSFLPEDGWFVVSDDAGVTTILAPSNDRYASAAFEQQDGRWEPTGWGDCVPRLSLDDKSVLRWAFAEDSYPPDSDATELSLLVTEVQCSSGREIEGLIEATVEYRETTVEVILTAPGLAGGKNVGYNCIGTAPTEYELVLDEPVGDRTVLDLSVYPVAEPTPGTNLP